MTFDRTSRQTENAQPGRWAFFLFLIFVSFSADAASLLHERAQELKLAENETWLRLLHIEHEPVASAESSIIDGDFFLSANSHKTVDPQQELTATISAFYLPPSSDSNNHAQCRYPARKLWLLEQTQLPNTELPIVTCSALEGWAKFKQLNSVSLIMVTGYFGNPASSFGHLMLKLNNGDAPDVKSLLDDGINYGAAVPEGEPTLVYILRGLLGGYRAGFTSKPFYSTDQVYTRTEFRDMWEYELDFTDYQLRLFVFHLWELSSAGFVYYFLDKNCAYRLAEMLELVTGYRFIPRNQPWYVPISTFKRLNTLNERYGGLIRSIKMQPSLQREAYKLAESLPPGLLAEANAYIRKPVVDVFADLSTEDSVKVVDTLLKYYNYKLGLGDEQQYKSLYATKAELLKLRFGLPAGKYQPKLEYTGLADPSKLSGPNRFQLGFSAGAGARDYVSLKYSPYYQDLLKRGNSENLAFTAMDLAFEINERGDVKLNHLTLADISKIRAEPAPYVGEPRVSWRVNLSARRGVNDELYSSATGGLGRAWKPAENTVLYGFGDVYVQSRDEAVGAALAIGTLYSFTNDSLKLQAEWQYRPLADVGSTHWLAKLRYSLSTEHELRFAIEDSVSSVYSLAWNYRW